MSDLRQLQQQLSELATTLDEALQEEKARSSSATAGNGRSSRRSATRTGDSSSSARDPEALIEQIAKAYKDLGTTRRKHARAESARRRHEIRVRVDNADALTTAKNERTEKLYLEGLLHTDEYRKLQDAEKAAELEHFEARAEVDRLQLTVKLLGRATAGPDEGEPAR